MTRKSARETLLALTRAERVEDPRTLFDTLADACLGTESPTGPAEIAIFYDIVARLLPMLGAADRRHAAARLAAREDLPPDLAREIADDEAAVAFPLVARSPVLTDDQLEALVRRGPRHRMAVAMRQRLGPQLAAAIAASGDRDATLALLRNHGAEIPADTMADLVEIFRDAPDHHSLLLARPDLPEALAERMYEWASAAIRAHAADAGGDDDPATDDGPEAVAQNPGEGEVPAAPTFEDTPETVLQPRPMRPAAGAAAATALLAALDERDIVRFEALFAQLTRLPPDRTERILYDAGPVGLGVACRAIGIAPDAFAEILFRLNGSGSRDGFARDPDVQQAIARFETTDPANARRILETWRSASVEGWGG